MLTNLILILIAIVSLVFIWLLWLRHHLVLELREIGHHRELLLSDLNKRKDMVPYLLESFKKTEPISDLLNRVVSERREFQNSQPLEKEWQFEHTLWTFLKDSDHVKSVQFLEAKKDIIEITTTVEKEKQNVEQKIATYNEHRKEFPYPFVSAIFGLREVSL